MQIRDDLEPMPETTPSRQRGASPMQRLMLRNPLEEETVRLPMSVLAFWREPENPELETLQVRLNLADNLDDDSQTLAGPLGAQRGRTRTGS